MMGSRTAFRILFKLAILSAFVGTTNAGNANEVDRQQTVARGVAFLLTAGQADDGSFSKSSGPAITAICVTALLRNGTSPEQPAVRRALKYLQGFIRKDGGIYQLDSLYQNYETCLAIMCMAEANDDGRYSKQIERATAFVKQLQWDETEDIDDANYAFGGGGYGKHGRPDLSNTSYLVEAIRASGADEDDEAIQAALLFVSRCQNHESEHNTTKFAPKNPDGGSYYTPAAGGQSQAGMTAQGGLRSYGSMTYAGLKSMIFAGVGSDDSRVKAAMTWISANYNLNTNPGLGDAGLYYYYHTFAKTLSVAKIDSIKDVDGKDHDWRADLVEVLKHRQQKNGSWVNGNERWLEGDPNLVTAYSLLALSYCKAE
ncbi:MAG: prenyltransferase/squalene oxidase repeat-containing protein [Pirellulaceae bacterium]